MVPPDSVNARWVTFNHAPYRLRQLHSGDESRLQDFFHSHSRETVHLRYGYTFTSMSRERAHCLVDIEEDRGVALGIFSVVAHDEILHAVGRYCVESNRSAEIAFVVRESKRRCGMATTLLHELARCAGAHGIDLFRAYVLRENYPMRRLFERYHPAVAEDLEGGSLEYVIKVRDINRISPRAT